jgi:two-component system cell cycle response regulator
MMVAVDRAEDEVLRTVARRLRHTLRTTDLLGRFAGTEFALLLPDAGAGSKALADRLCRAISGTPVDTDAGPVRVAASVGVAYLHPDDGDTATLLSRAEMAMNRARESGRNQIVLIDEAS